MDEDLARWALVKAAEADMSLSRVIAEVLGAKRLETRTLDPDYRAAMESYLSRPAYLTSNGPLPGREERHSDRSRRLDRDDYLTAMNSYLARPAVDAGQPGQRLPKREELCDRPNIR